MKSLQMFTLSLGMIFMMGCSNSDTVTERIAESISPALFKAKIDELKGAHLIDVRTPAEWSNGMIKGALKIDFLGSEFNDRINELEKNIPVLVYCASGGRSSKAMNILVEKGFVTVYDLDGGFGAWMAKGYPHSK